MKIMMKDIVVAEYEPINGLVAVLREDLMPHALFLEEGDDFDARYNNRTNFEFWCASRVLSLDRVHAKEILNSCGLSQAQTDRDRCQVALRYHCLSLADSFWVQQDDEDLRWEDVCLFNHSLNEVVVDVSLSGKNYSITNTELIAPDCSTPGVFPKAWVREEDGFYLYKGDVNGSVQREVEASKILQKLGIPVLNYDYAEWGGQVTSKCKLFTSPDVGLVTAEHYGYNNEVGPLLDENFHYLNLATFLVGDSDKHMGNWGFLFDENGIIGFAPLMDFNHAFEARVDSLSLPNQFIGKKCNQLEAAVEAMKHVALKDADLSEFHYGEFVKERMAVLEKALSVDGIIQNAEERTAASVGDAKDRDLEMR